MVKTVKKAAPGGDERNSCVRRNKPTTTASPKISESERQQRESDNSNRPKLSNIQKKVLTSSAKKSKLHNAGNNYNQLIKNLDKDTIKEGKVLQHLRLVKQKMQSKVDDEEESTSSSIIVEKDQKEETVNDVDNKKEEEEVAATKDSNTNHTTDEQESTTTNTNIEEKTAESIDEDTTTTTTKTITTTITTTSSTKNEIIKSQDEDNEKKDHLEENNKKCNEQEQDEEEIHLMVDDSPAKSPDTISTISIMNDENELEELPQIQEVNDDTKEKKSSQTESEAGTESCSVDIVESVTSELSEASEPLSQQETQKSREHMELNVKNEILCINYDASVTLKDVQIKLNDCLKEKLKNVVDECENDNNESNLSLNDTFGKTLRNISGRTAIDRFRHSSSYDFWCSPNNSQKVLMSNSSRRETPNTKILRYSTGLSDVMSSNGSFIERKRKSPDSPESLKTLKKQKMERSSLLNKSVDIIKGLRKPIQISTPNISYKVQSDKINIRELNVGNNKFLPTHNTDDDTRKWCVIM